MFWRPGVFFFGFLMSFSSILVVELFYLVGFRPILTNFWYFQQFCPCAHSHRGFFWPKITVQGQKHCFFRWFRTFLTIFHNFWSFSFLCPPNPYELRPCIYETEAAYQICPETTRIRWGYIIGPQQNRNSHIVLSCIVSYLCSVALALYWISSYCIVLYL